MVPVRKRKISMRGMERTAQVMGARGGHYSSHVKEENKDPGRKKFQLQSQEKGTEKYSSIDYPLTCSDLICSDLP
jgi:hypothetical protein